MSTTSKPDRYHRIIAQLQGLFANGTDPLGRMATISALLSHKMPHFFWTGFYFLREGSLYVGPYQGPLACMVLQGKGVCLQSVADKRAIIVPDVHQFEGHIACDSRSNSEIAVPVFQGDDIVAVLDVDSQQYGAFDEVDAQFLQFIASMVYS